MKKLVVVVILTSLFACGVALSSPKYNKAHAGKKGLDSEVVNCAYCHADNKAKLPRPRGNDLAAAKKTKYCAMKDCH